MGVGGPASKQREIAGAPTVTLPALAGGVGSPVVGEVPPVAEVPFVDGSEPLDSLVAASGGAVVGASGSTRGGPASPSDGGNACVGAVVSVARGRSRIIPPPKTRTKPPMREPSATIATVRGG